MHLRDYITEQKITQADFGQRIKPAVSQAKVNHWLQGQRRVSLVEALQIQEITCGCVTVEDLAKLADQPATDLATGPVQVTADAAAAGCTEGQFVGPERRYHDTPQNPDLERREPLAAKLAGLTDDQTEPVAQQILVQAASETVAGGG